MQRDLGALLAEGSWLDDVLCLLRGTGRPRPLGTSLSKPDTHVMRFADNPGVLDMLSDLAVDSALRSQDSETLVIRAEVPRFLLVCSSLAPPE